MYQHFFGILISFDKFNTFTLVKGGQDPESTPLSVPPTNIHNVYNYIEFLYYTNIKFWNIFIQFPFAINVLVYPLWLIQRFHHINFKKFSYDWLFSVKRRGTKIKFPSITGFHTIRGSLLTGLNVSLCMIQRTFFLLLCNNLWFHITTMWNINILK